MQEPQDSHELKTLIGDRVILRAPRESDKADRLRWGRSAEVIRMYGVLTEDGPIAESKVDEWFDSYSEMPLAWVIEHEGQCVGTARLHNLDLQSKSASYAIGMFSTEHLGKGFGTEATRLVLAYAFQDLALHRVSLRVLSFNLRAISCYEKCGFKREGLERETTLVSGQWCDDVIMGLLANEWSR